MAKQDTYIRYTIRVPEDLYRRVQEAAGEKSVNAEIIARLEQSFEVPSLLIRADQNLERVRHESDSTIADLLVQTIRLVKDLNELRREIARLRMQLDASSQK